MTDGDVKIPSSPVYYTSFDPITNTASGKIVQSEAVFENSTSNGSFTFAKKVEGYGAPENDEFKFILTGKNSDGSDLSGTFTLVGYSESSTVTFAKGKATSPSVFKLKDGQNVTITGLPEGAKITVTETVIPEDYTLITIDEDERTGTISSTDAATVVIENKYESTEVKTNISISKTDDNEDPLAGAILRFYAVDEDNKETVLEYDEIVLGNNTSTQTGVSNNSIIITTGSEKPAITIKGLAPGKYWLEEITPPEYYEPASPISIVVAADGTVTYNDKSATNNNVIMVDEKSDVNVLTLSVSKKAIAGTAEVSGASLTITSDAEGKAVVNDALSEEPLSWTSGSAPKEVHLHDGKYYLHETGGTNKTFTSGGVTYTIVDSALKFTVKDGKITDVENSTTSTDDEYGKGFYSVDKDNGSITVNDGKASGTLVIKKTILIDGDKVTDEEIAGGLKFTVETRIAGTTWYIGKDGKLTTTKYEFTIKDDFDNNGKANTDGEFTKTFNNLPEYNYTITETNSTIGDGYTLTTEITPKNAAVVGNETRTVEIEDKYATVAKKGDLKITKSVDGLNITENERDGLLTFTVKAPDGKYLDKNGNLNETEQVITLKDGFVKQDDGTYVLFFDDVAIGDYVVTEKNADIAGYTATVKINNTEQKSVTVAVADGTETEVAITDSYTEIEKKGDLKITKSIDGLNVTEEELSGALKFTVVNESGKYIKEDGTVFDGEGKYEIALGKFTKVTEGADEGKYVLELNDIPIGKYSVTETNRSDFANYTFQLEISTISGSAEVTEDSTASVALSNVYKKNETYGGLKITKSFDGLNVTEEELSGALKFTVVNEGGKYIKEDGTVFDGEGKYEITLDKFTKVTEGTDKGKYVLEFKNIPTGKYIVTETDTAVDGYKFISERSTTCGEKEVTENNTALVEIVDAYEEIETWGNLKITKSFDGLNVSDEEKAGKLTFTIINEDGKYIKEDGKVFEGSGPYDITLSKFIKATEGEDNGKYILELNNVPTGKYIVTESNTSIANYTFRSELSTTSGSATVEKGKTATVAIVNKYEENNDLIITKTFSGDTISEEEKAGKLKFTVQNEKGKYLKADGTLSDDEIKLTLSDFNLDNGIYTLKFEKVPEGRYTVTETNSDVAGYTVKVKINSEEKTSKTVEVTTTTPGKADIVDEYTKQPVTANFELTKTIKGDITNEDLSGLKFEIFEDGKTEAFETVYLRNFETKPESGVKGVYKHTVKNADTSKKYYVVETLTTLEGFDVKVKYSVNGNILSENKTTSKFDVNADGTTKVDYENDYTKQPVTANFELTKTIKGDITNEDLSGLKFEIFEEGKTEAFETILLKDFETKPESGVKGVYKHTVKNADTSKKYYVVETLTTLEGFDVTAKYSVNGGTSVEGKETSKFGVNADGTTKVDYENEYTRTTPETGSIKLTKTIKGDVTNKDLSGLKFTVNSTDGTYTKEVSLSEFTKTEGSGEGTKGEYIYTITDVDSTKTYTVTETLTTLEGFSVTVKYQIGEGALTEAVNNSTSSFTVAVNDVQSVAYENVYTSTTSETGSLVITKTVDGDNLTEEEYKDKLTFSILNKNTNEYYYVVNGEVKTSESEHRFTIAVGGFVFDTQNNRWTLTLAGVPAGTYEVSEVNSAVPGYVLKQESVTSGKSDVVEGQTAQIELKDVYEKEETSKAKVRIELREVPYTETNVGGNHPDERIVKDNIPIENEVEFALRKKGDDTDLYTWKNTEADSKEFELEDGDYEIVQKNTPTGYVKNEVVEFSVKNGKVVEPSGDSNYEIENIGDGTQKVVVRAKPVTFELRIDPDTIAPELFENPPIKFLITKEDGTPFPDIVINENGHRTDGNEGNVSFTPDNKTIIYTPSVGKNDNPNDKTHAIKYLPEGTYKIEVPSTTIKAPDGTTKGKLPRRVIIITVDEDGNITEGGKPSPKKSDTQKDSVDSVIEIRPIRSRPVPPSPHDDHGTDDGTPVNPGPTGPSGPTGPTGPTNPPTPSAPSAPASPVAPVTPATPVKPADQTPVVTEDVSAGSGERVSAATTEETEQNNVKTVLIICAILVAASIVTRKKLEKKHR
ncbi:MAG: DUF5979 domain-containing protein [Oscillospiraceae bacterium]|nr:DUF5979 domain-containing protein [Oscillospiraceae bacterium]